MSHASRGWLLGMVALVACMRSPVAYAPPRGHDAGVTTQAPPGSNAAAVDYAESITDAATWRVLAASPGRQMAAHTEVVKVIIDLDQSWRVYFLQSRRWEIHYDFASRYLSSVIRPVEDHAAFNIREYRRPDRRFILGTLTHYLDQDVWAYDLIAGDTLDLDRTVRAFETIRQRVFFRDALRYRPVPPAHEAATETLRARGLPIVTTATLFGATRYQSLNPGEAFGWLRFVQEPLDPSRVRRTDIVVVEGVPIDLPVCSAIITSELQAPLSHLAVLATNRGTPDMALREAFRDPRLRALEGRLVRLRVTPQDWSVEVATQAQAERAWEAMRPRAASVPPLSEEDVGLPLVRQLRARDVRTVGAKAAQLGELAAIGEGITVPRGFAVPFRAYREHFRASGAEAILTAAMAREAFRDDPTVRAETLRQVREAIERRPVSAAGVSAVRSAIAAQFAGTRVRFRSSTNAEDLRGFNGAGLYRSVVVDAQPSNEAIANALRAVWASVWSLQGYEERAYFRIDQSAVAMAVLVQESIDDDVVDGVAITANPFNEGRPGIFLNAQVAGAEGGSVTAAGDAVPEQVIYYTYGEEGEFERISRSSRTNGGLVLTDPEVLRLAPLLQRVHAHFNHFGMSETPMEVEFLLAGPSRRMVFVQARPYPIRYDHGREMAPQGE